MIEDVTAGGVYWNEAKRLPALLTILKATFSHVVVVIQDSTDDSYKIACQLLDRPGDHIRTDAHRGAGDPSIPIMVQTVETPWTFVISGDEQPSVALLESIPEALAQADRDGLDGWWLKFRSTIDGFDFTSEQDNHLRLFRTSVGWPHSTLHSRPMTENTGFWPTGWIDHDRSLDEMIRDYLRYMAIGRDSAQWVAHNQRMIHDACERVAERAGWRHVTSHPWWPDVRDIAFGGKDPQ